MNETQARYAVALAEYEAALYMAADDMPEDPPEGADDATLDAWADACGAASDAHGVTARREALREAEERMIDWALAYVPNVSTLDPNTLAGMRAYPPIRAKLVDLCFRLDASEVTGC